MTGLVNRDCMHPIAGQTTRSRVGPPLPAIKLIETTRRSQPDMAALINSNCMNVVTRQAAGAGVGRPALAIKITEAATPGPKPLIPGDVKGYSQNFIMR